MTKLLLILILFWPFLFFNHQILWAFAGRILALEFRTCNMAGFKIIYIVLSYSWTSWRKVLNLIQVMLFKLWRTYRAHNLRSLWAFEVTGWSRCFLILTLVYNNIRDSFSWISIHFSWEWSCLRLGLINIGCRNILLDFEYIINIILFMLWPIHIGLFDIALVMITLRYNIFEILPLVVAVCDIIHLLNGNPSITIL